MHALLARQLKRLGLDAAHIPPTAEVWQALLERVHQSYQEGDRGRALLERSLDLTSQEMLGLYEGLQRSGATELARERNKLEAVLHSLGDGLCVVDDQWRIVMMNEQAESLLGWPLSALLGQAVYHYVSPGPEAFSHECLITDQSLPPLEQGKPFRTDDGLLLRPDGQMIPINLVVTPVIVEEIVTGAVLVFRDISAQKEAQIKRDEKARQIRLIQAGLLQLATHPDIHGGSIPHAFKAITRIAAQSLQVARVSIWFFSSDHTVLRCANLYEQPVQRDSSGQELAQTDFPRYFSEMASGELIAAADARTSPTTSEFTDGYLVPLGITSMLDAPIRSKGRLAGVICHEQIGPVRNWTIEEQQFALSAAKAVSLTLEAAERQQAVQALRTSEARLSMTVKSTHIGVWDWDLQTNAVSYSPEWTAQLGYTQSEFSPTRESWQSLIHPDDQARANHFLTHYLQHRLGTYELEYRLRHRDGSYRWILVRGALFESPEAPATRMVGIHIDLTGQKQVEEALRTAKETAEAANIAKSQFLANMSHEIRTPMNGVLGLTELLQHSDLAPRQRQLAQSIHQSGTALLDILNDILDFSKIEAGKLRLDSIPFSLPNIAEDLCDLFAESARRKQLEFGYLIDGPTPPTLQGDPTRLRQILVNLMSNAIKFTEQGEVFLLIKVLDISATHAQLRIEVTDTGIGLPAASHTEIFQPFVQADGSAARRHGGTGLGLAIVSHLVRLMDGTIGVESTEGRGSTFWFTLSLPTVPHAVRPPLVPPSTLVGKRLLIVDDTETNRHIVAHHLTTWQVLHESAESGPQALARLRTAFHNGHPFDGVLLDKHMPGMSGLDLAKAISSDPQLHQTKLILLSSSGLDTSDHVVQHGLHAVLTKPIKAAYLQDSLDTVFGQPRHPMPPHPTLLPTAPQPITHPRGGRILLVEDNPLNREVAVGMLELCGYHVDEVCNGREAVEATTKTPYSLVLMDCQMPDMDGLEATRRIREREQQMDGIPNGRLPIVALTAHTMAGDRERCLHAGMDDYLSKPFTQQQLHTMVTRWLSRDDAPPAQPPNDSSIPDSAPAQPTAVSGQAPPDSVQNTSLSLEGIIDQTAWEPIRQLARPGKSDLLHKLLATYLDDTQTHLGHLRKAVETQDASAVFATAHRLKSSSATLGCIVVAARCADLEAMGRAQQLDRAPECFRQLEQAFAAVHTLFHAMLAQEPQS